jgi:hypothetical protein
MRIRKTILLYLGLPAICWPTTPVPYGAYIDLLDRVLAVARSQSPARDLALKLIEQVAEGQTGGISPESEEQIGLKPGQLRQEAFHSVPVREAAIWRIGETGSPNAVSFLANLKPADFADDSTNGLWAMTQVALRNAALVRITDPRERTEFLKGVLTEGGFIPSDGPAGSWAIDELCNSGAAAALPEIEGSIRKSKGEPGEQDIEFCKARIQVVSRDPDRAKALGSVLSLDAQPNDNRLVWWAISQLTAMHTAAADAEMERFAAQVNSLPRESPIRRRLLVFRAGISSIRPW